MAFVRPKVISLFSYSTLKTRLYLDEKALEITFLKPNLTHEVLFELESILSWCKTHVEVHSLVFSGNNQKFIGGFDTQELKNFDAEKVKRLHQKFENILETLSELSQLIIMNLGNGASDQALELALQGDFIFTKKESTLELNHMKQGLIPSLKTEKKLGTQTLKKILFSPNAEVLNQLVNKDLVQYFTEGMNETEEIESFKRHAATLSHVARYYLKKSLGNDENFQQTLIETRDYQNESGNFQNLHRHLYPELQKDM